MSLNKEARENAKSVMNESNAGMSAKVYSVDARGAKEINDIFIKSKVNQKKLQGDDDIFKINLGVAP